MIANGVLVVGYSNIILNGEEIESPGKKGGIEIGDMIKKVNGNKIENSKDLIEKMNNLGTEGINLEILRDKKKINKDITIMKEDDNRYKLGLWIRDSQAGVGTITFYEEKSKKFAALGHPITDESTNSLYEIKSGEILPASIISVKKGEKGYPGELKGIFTTVLGNLGNIENNTKYGIYGCTKEKCSKDERIKVGFKEEIKLGKAYIITTLDERGPRKYEIEITRIFKQAEAEVKSMVIKVTDEELLEKTGGIVQGMSGSPIIQNDKIIGAVTHVLVNKPDVGYGIYIEWMLEESKIL